MAAGAAATGCLATRPATVSVPSCPAPTAGATGGDGAAAQKATGGAAFGAGRGGKAATAANAAHSAKPSRQNAESNGLAAVPGCNGAFSNQVETNENPVFDNCPPELLDAPENFAALPVFFTEILEDLGRYQRELGGVKNWRGQRPRIERKVTAAEFRDTYTDYEYIYLTVLGFAQLHMHCEEIVRKNNGKVFKDNPGVQILEQRCGMTMHGDRAGANHLLRTGPASIVEAFALAKMDKAGMQRFFREAFDRTADPCLEGRVSRLMEYLDVRRQETDASLARAPPWDDVSLRPLDPEATAQQVVGEHLRVFVNECTWRFATEKGLEYAKAKELRVSDEPTQREFGRLFNAVAFEAAMLARGVAADAEAKQWQVNTDGDRWMPYSEEQNEVLERSRLLGLRRCEVRVHSWMYEIDFGMMVQRNRKTRKERPIRCVDAPVNKKQGRLTLEELKGAVEYFVGLDTIPRASPDLESPPSEALPAAVAAPKPSPASGEAAGSSDTSPAQTGASTTFTSRSL